MGTVLLFYYVLQIHVEKLVMCVVKISYFMSAFLVSSLMTIFMYATDLIIFAMSLFIISILKLITEHVIFHLLKLLLMQVVLIAFVALRMEFISLVIICLMDLYLKFSL
jgi:hypothetical protein